MSTKHLALDVPLLYWFGEDALLLGVEEVKNELEEFGSRKRNDTESVVIETASLFLTRVFNMVFREEEYQRR